MSKKYPRFGSVMKKYDWKKTPNPPACEICGADSVIRIWMQVGWMRGDDEDFKVCGEHYDMAKKDAEGFYKAYFAAQENDNGEESDQPEQPVAPGEGNQAE